MSSAITPPGTQTEDCCEITDPRLDAGVPCRAIERARVRLHIAFDGADAFALSALGRRWNVVDKSIERVPHYVHRETAAR
jgi:hypothetical protein